MQKAGRRGDADPDLIPPQAEVVEARDAERDLIAGVSSSEIIMSRRRIKTFDRSQLSQETRRDGEPLDLGNRFSPSEGT